MCYCAVLWLWSSAHSMSPLRMSMVVSRFMGCAAVAVLPCGRVRLSMAWLLRLL